MPTCVLWVGSGFQMSFTRAMWYLKLFSDLHFNFQKLGNFIYKSKFHSSLGNLEDLSALDLYLSMRTVMRYQVTAGPFVWAALWFPMVPWVYLVWLWVFVAVWWNCSLHLVRGYWVGRGADVFSGALDSETSISNASCRRQSLANWSLQLSAAWQCSRLPQIW